MTHGLSKSRKKNFMKMFYFSGRIRSRTDAVSKGCFQSISKSRVTLARKNINTVQPIQARWRWMTTVIIWWNDLPGFFEQRPSMTLHLCSDKLFHGIAYINHLIHQTNILIYIWSLCIVEVWVTDVLYRAHLMIQQYHDVNPHTTLSDN